MGQNKIESNKLNLDASVKRLIGPRKASSKDRQANVPPNARAIVFDQ
jgi:hypothetical protein